MSSTRRHGRPAVSAAVFYVSVSGTGVVGGGVVGCLFAGCGCRLLDPGVGVIVDEVAGSWTGGCRFVCAEEVEET